MNNEYENYFKNINYQGFADYLTSLSGAEYLLICTILSLAITDNLSTTSSNSIGNFFMLLGQSILTVTGQNIGKRVHGATEENIMHIRKEIEQIKRRLDNL